MPTLKIRIYRFLCPCTKNGELRMFQERSVEVDLTVCPRCGELAAGFYMGEGSSSRQLPHYERVTITTNWSGHSKPKCVLKW